MTVRLAIRGIGVLGPGLAGWEAARDVLAGKAPWRDEAPASPDVRELPATERRRVNAASRWAIAVAREATASLGTAATAPISAVFASADGDGEVLDQTLAALASPDPSLSPTLFHNSVFNAPVGYWSIATHSTGWTTMICAGEGSAAAALAESASQARVTGGAVLCVCMDLGYPARLAGLHPTARSFACALLLDAATNGGEAFGSLAIGTSATVEIGPAAGDPIAKAFDGNAGAMLIPLLARIARRRSGPVLLPRLGGGMLAVEVVVA